MRADLIDQHIAAMTAAGTNLLRQMASEGLRYHLAIAPEDTGTLHVRVHGLTPDVEMRIRRCLGGTGMRLSVAEGIAEA